MPRLLDYLNPIYVWLAALDPSLPRALFVGLVFLSVLIWRKVSPDTWLGYSSLIGATGEDATWLQEQLRKLWQAVPSAALGAVYGALGTGGDVWASVKLAMLGLAAPVIHEVAWRYQGRIGKPARPQRPLGAVLVLALLVAVPSGVTGCSPNPKTSADLVERGTALAFNGAATVLLLLDHRETSFLDSLASPTKDQLDAATLRIARLERARVALATTRRWLTGELEESDGRLKLREAVSLLEVVVAELRASNARLPDELDQALRLAKAVL